MRKSLTQWLGRRTSRGGLVVIGLLLTACGESPTDVPGGLPDGDYVVTTSSPRIVNEFVTPGWMREMPVIEFTKSGDSFVVTDGDDGLVVVGPVQLAENEGTFWRVHFGWAPLEEHHYWEILMNAEECAAAAVDADLGVPPNGALTVVLRICSIEAR